MEASGMADDCREESGGARFFLYGGYEAEMGRENRADRGSRCACDGLSPRADSAESVGEEEGPDVRAPRGS
jgi:hypothetical protein